MIGRGGNYARGLAKSRGRIRRMRLHRINRTRTTVDYDSARFFAMGMIVIQKGHAYETTNGHIIKIAELFRMLLISKLALLRES